jgi:hypothetical protein
MLTTTEAAALLAERGVKGYKGRGIQPDTVKRWCYQGKFPNAKHYAGSGRGVWLIPQEDVEALSLLLTSAA